MIYLLTRPTACVHWKICMPHCRDINQQEQNLPVVYTVPWMIRVLHCKGSHSKSRTYLLTRTIAWAHWMIYALPCREISQQEQNLPVYYCILCPLDDLHAPL
jgi:hypothetical protein